MSSMEKCRHSLWCRAEVIPLGPGSEHRGIVLMYVQQRQWSYLDSGLIRIMVLRGRLSYADSARGTSPSGLPFSPAGGMVILLVIFVCYKGALFLGCFSTL